VKGEDQSASPLELLTEKQREVLELMLQHKKPKEIARILGISPHKVYQRIQFAKERLQVAGQSDLAAEYLRLRSQYERFIYEESPLPNPVVSSDDERRNDGADDFAANSPDRIEAGQVPSGAIEYRVVPEMFDGRHGTIARIGAIVALTFLLILVILGGLALFSQTSEIMAQ